MLSAAASTIPRLRLATQPRARIPSARFHWLRPLSSATYVTAPAAAAGAGAGSLEPPDLPRLANAARISLSTQEGLILIDCSARQAEEFEPKIRQVVDWFGQLQAVDLESIEPSLRAGTAAGSSLRGDTPETFVNRDAIVEAIPSYDDPYIKVPRVLNKE
ncbi:glutamyl-tRNA(Gln) amidotransferase subunit C, chloroplastic/mitochondrial-like [Panicum miliaceum]|uniref:Glutamyl-tRNA(Gln) amidotransferase subunit C, chloroplastic/mitochondrial n=1 Tax=Panicum miliaceum TaxID=4540 RepID=A0A3L6TTX9_PANMI|nr:glutamyl-tRNA(Gln) amidotransferase subunit C, chloroplastic/mitochondrial-like [Panicum miliaceum]